MTVVDVAFEMPARVSKGLSGHCACEEPQSPAERRTRWRLVRVPALSPRSRSALRARELRRANSMPASRLASSGVLSCSTHQIS